MSTSLSIRRGRLIVLPVRFRHRVVLRRRMVLDTGARESIIRPDTADLLGLELRECPDAEIVGVAGSAPASEGTVNGVSVLGYTVRNVTVLCQPLDPRFTFDGILGLDVIRHFNVSIDNDDEKLTLEPCLG